MSVWISADKTLDDKQKKKLAKKFGYPPVELEYGFLVEKFTQTPFQLGLCETNDIALLYRCMEVYRIYNIAQRASEDASSLSIDEGLLAGRMFDAINRRRIPKKWRTSSA